MRRDHDMSEHTYADVNTARRNDGRDSDFDKFLAQYGEDYQPEDAIDFDVLRAQEYGRLDEQGQVYLDSVGGALHGKSQVEKHAEVLNSTVLGNPHSVNPSSQLANQMEEECRAAIFKHFNADPDEYDVIFTSNATNAVRLVGEAFPFGWRGRFLHTADSHNCVVGIRRFAQAQHAKTVVVPVDIPEYRLDHNKVIAELDKGTNAPKLFALTGQSNTTGVKHSLDMVGEAQRRGWTVLLDAAALAPTSMIDLGKYHPDFVSLSFYKMFGYPTGIGALIARRAALAKLKRPWFSGGTVRVVSAFHKNINFMHSRSNGMHFQDGTMPYSVLPAITIGLEHLARVDQDALARRISALTRWTIAQLANVTTPSGERMVKIYGPENGESRGGTLAINMFDRHGRWVPHRILEKVAAANNISLRAGCFCNPGVAEQALGYTPYSEKPTGTFLTAAMSQANKVGIDRLLGQLKPFDYLYGMARPSFGIASNFDDARAFVRIVQEMAEPDHMDELMDDYEAKFKPPTTLC
jgi:selenocysteine lyase/cysteine desulfurase